MDRISRRRVPGKVSEGQNKAEIVWHTAEGNIDNTDADVLVIFDCCHAGNLGRGYGQSRWSNRCSEYLGATSANSTTPIPGESSFTSGLIWALDELVDEPCGFTTSELRRKITESPNFPKDQIPVLCERSGSASLKHIVISPITTGATAPDTHRVRTSEDQSKAIVDYLDLRVLTDRPFSDHEVGSMSNLLSDLIRTGQLPARRVALLDNRHTQIVRAVASKWRNHARRSGNMSSIAIPGISKGQPPSPSPVLSLLRETAPDDFLRRVEPWDIDNEQRSIRYHLRMLLLVLIGRFWATLSL